jgi:hypothetical protein
MSLDIGDILNSWPFKPGEVNVRRIVGDDGREKIQLRLDLGLLQMETTGRPDGQRPNGHASLLAYYESLLEDHRERYGEEDKPFTLDSEACESLRAEGVMYYHRYLAAFVLGDYESVVRDTRRNLRLFDFCMRWAEDKREGLVLEQYRPYVIMMHARALCRLHQKHNRPQKALKALREAIGDIESFYQTYGQDEAVESSSELAILRAMARDVKASLPVDPKTRLKRDLRKAVQEERYEDAARLRDELDQLAGSGQSEDE